MAIDEAEIERRIAARMQKLWHEAGCHGRAEDFREQARMIVAVEDSQDTALLPIEPPGAEPAGPVRNLGEFPTMTDQGEGEAFPDRAFIPEER